MSSRNSTTAASTSASTTYPSWRGETTTTSRPRTGRSRARPMTCASNLNDQRIICAISESRGVSPTVGLAFLNLDASEAVLCQICDSQTYVRTMHKLFIFAPTEILIVTTAADPKSKLFSIIEDNLRELNCNIRLLDRRYWAETTGLEYIQQLAVTDDMEALKIAITGNYFAVCCIAAVLKHVETNLSTTFSFHSLRIKYESAEGSMMIDVATIRSLELIQNLQNPKSKDCLFGLVNECSTPMGARLLRSNILQRLTEADTLNARYDALEELSTKEEMFHATREALSAFLDADRTLTSLILIPTIPSVKVTEQAVNNVIMLKQFMAMVPVLFEALTGAQSEILKEIQGFCAPSSTVPIQDLIDSVINEDTAFQSKPLDLRNQRIYAVKSGVNGLLDVARQTYKESSTDVYQHVSELSRTHLTQGFIEAPGADATVSETHELALELKFDNVRQFYIRLAASELEDRPLPPIFTNVFKKKGMIECQTLELAKRNHKILDSHNEVLLMSDKAVHDLIIEVRGHLPTLFKICESVAMLDMIASFAQLVVTQDYVRPKLTDTLAIKAGRHPIREKAQAAKFIPNDVYSTQQSRFQIVTGCNMSGKSTYIRMIALLVVLAQIGSFVPAEYAEFPIKHQLFARVSVDDSIEANVSTFAAEMRETAFILRNVDKRSIAIVDELGRGTSPQDGLAIAIAIAEALVSSRALVWFATHFRDLATIMAERNGVVNLHMSVELSPNQMTMLYRIAGGIAQEQHYGLALASLMPFPPEVLERANIVADQLDQRMIKKKKTSQAVLLAKRRRLVRSLKEHLLQAQRGQLDDKALSAWLKELRKEFVLRMSALEVEAAQAQNESEDEQDGIGSRSAGDEQETEDGTDVYMQESLDKGSMMDQDAT